MKRDRRENRIADPVKRHLLARFDLIDNNRSFWGHLKLTMPPILDFLIIVGVAFKLDKRPVGFQYFFDSANFLVNQVKPVLE